MHVADFKVELNSSFEMSDLGLLHHYLGIQFKQYDGGIAFCQQFGLEDCKPIATPMETGLHLSVHDAGDYYDATLYHSISRLLVALFMYAFRGLIFSLQSHR